VSSRAAYAGDLHVPLGMTTPEEVAQIVGVLREERALDRTVLYACTSGYPVPFDQLCLLEIRELVAHYGTQLRRWFFRPSSWHRCGRRLHTRSAHSGSSAISRWIAPGRATDHAASLEPDGLRRLVRDVRAISQALTLRDRPILDIEVPQRQETQALPAAGLRQCADRLPAAAWRFQVDPGKNIRPLAGRPLFAWALGAAVDSGASSKIWVGTDAAGIRREVEQQFATACGCRSCGGHLH